MLNLKDLAHNVENVTHALADKITHAAHNIADLTRPLGDRVENFFKNKEIAVSRETRQSNDFHNIVISSDGSFSTNNNADLTRELLNHVLFLNKGEVRISEAMSNNQKSHLHRVTNPQKDMHPTMASQLVPHTKSHD